MSLCSSSLLCSASMFAHVCVSRMDARQRYTGGCKESAHEVRRRGDTAEGRTRDDSDSGREEAGRDDDEMADEDAAAPAPEEDPEAVDLRGGGGEAEADVDFDRLLRPRDRAGGDLDGDRDESRVERLWLERGAGGDSLPLRGGLGLLEEELLRRVRAARDRPRPLLLLRSRLRLRLRLRLGLGLGLLWLLPWLREDLDLLLAVCLAAERGGELERERDGEGLRLMAHAVAMG